MTKMTIDELLENRLKANKTQTVNVETYLSTDYLNHYNEVIMLIEMLPDMPDVIDMIMEWQPKSYVQHFEECSLPERAIAIELYAIAPEKFKTQYDKTIQNIDEILLTALESLKQIDVVNDKDKLTLILEKFAEIHKYTSIIANTVNGQLMDESKYKLIHMVRLDEIDDLFFDMGVDESEWCLETETFDQADIDALFD